MTLERAVRAIGLILLGVSLTATLSNSEEIKRAERRTPVAAVTVPVISTADAIEMQKSMQADFSPSKNMEVRTPGTTSDNPLSTSIAYAIDVRNQRKVKINLGTGSVTAFGGASEGKPFYAGDFNNQGIWYGISNPDTLFRIDTTTGAYTQVGLITGIPAGSNTSGITWDYSTNTMYLCNLLGGVATLYTLDIAGLSVTPIGAIVTGTVIDIACSNTGQIYGVKFAPTAGLSDSLISINKSTGAGTTVGALGVDVNFAHGLDFDPVTDSLFYPGYIGSGVNNLYKINTSTGAATLVFALAAGEYDAFAVAGSPSAPPTNVINESFEGATFPPTGWAKLNPDGGTGWNRQTNGTTPMPGWQGGTITTPPGGGNGVAYCTWNTGGAASNDQWLVTPRVMNVQSNDSLKFWHRWWPNTYSDTLEVRISTTTPTVGNFNVVVATLGFPTGSTIDTGWVEKNYRLSNFVSAGSNIYIAFRERVADNFNNGASFSLDLVRVTGVSTYTPELISTLPEGFKLDQNYPNPFNPSTTFRFSIPSSNSVTLKVYNTLGQEVATLVDGEYQAGTYSYQWDASGLASGVYFYRLQAGQFSESRTLMLVK